MQHKDNFVAMAKDLKLNIYQYTPAQIRKKLEKYEKMLALAEQCKQESEALAKIRAQQAAKAGQSDSDEDDDE